MEKIILLPVGSAGFSPGSRNQDRPLGDTPLLSLISGGADVSRINARIEGEPLTILIDSGGSDNFIRDTLVPAN